MIEDILKERKPGDKPRFFLHDEMKEWLKENLSINMTAVDEGSTDYNLRQKLSLYEDLTTGVNIDLDISIAGENIIRTVTPIHMRSHEKAFQTLANVVENCMIKITQLEADNQELKRRIELIENPLPV